MQKIVFRLVGMFLLSLMLFSANTSATAALIKGIYITQSTLENKNRITYLIQQAKNAGINTFVIDLDQPSHRYQENIQLIKNSHITYVARVVIFPNGGTPEQVKSQAYWEKRYQLIETAVNYGANEIQLDYIRYNSKEPGSSQNSKDIYQVIHWYKEKLASQKIPLQIDVFGVASFGESKYIGQNIKLFADTIDGLCPMVYPSHYVPFPQHFATPYETVYGSLHAIKQQFKDSPMPFKLTPYIELSNYHYKLSQNKKMEYIYAQIRAAEDAGADGWLAWSPHNQYDSLFQVLETHTIK